MYDPHGRYRYFRGFVSQLVFFFHTVAISDIPKNWRAVLALLVTVGPTFPGLINTINPVVNVGLAAHLFDIAWIYGVRFQPPACPTYAQSLSSL